MFNLRDHMTLITSGTGYIEFFLTMQAERNFSNVNRQLLNSFKSDVVKCNK